MFFTQYLINEVKMGLFIAAYFVSTLILFTFGCVAFIISSYLIKKQAINYKAQTREWKHMMGYYVALPVPAGNEEEEHKEAQIMHISHCTASHYEL